MADSYAKINPWFQNGGCTENSYTFESKIFILEGKNSLINIEECNSSKNTY